MKFLTCSLGSLLLLSSTAYAYQSYEVRSSEETSKSSVMLELSDEMRDEFDEVKRQIKENGYYSTYSENATLLMGVRSKKALELSKKDSDPYFKNLRLKPSEFRMTFPFEGISSVDDEHLLGFAPSGSLSDGGLDDGYWSGVTAYFTDDHFGVCRFVVFDMPAWNAKSIYDSTYTTFEINNKPTTKGAEGNTESGFIYETSWTGKRYGKQLECANPKPFNKQMLNDLVTYAKKIDNDLPDTP